MQKILIAALCLSLFLAGSSGNGLGSSSNPDSSSASSQSAPEEVLDCGEYIDGNTGEVLDTSPLIQFAAAAQEGKAAKVYIQKTTAEGDPIGYTLTYQDGVYTLLVDSRADQFAAEEDRKISEYTYSNLVTFPSPGGVDGDLTFTEWWLTDNPKLTAETAWEEESAGFLLLATRSNG